MSGTREPPSALRADDVLALVRRHWSPEVDRVEPLPVGSGARHWQALVGFRPTLFVTHDPLPGPHDHTAGPLEAAYASAAELAFGLDVVVAGLPTHGLTYTVPAGAAAGALSVTPWVHGERPDDDPTGTLALLARLHATRPPRGLPRWTPLDVADDRYRRLAEAATSRPWVVTHGAPTARHQLDTPVRRLLVGWADVRLAPPRARPRARAGHRVRPRDGRRPRDARAVPS